MLLLSRVVQNLLSPAAGCAVPLLQWVSGAVAERQSCNPLLLNSCQPCYNASIAHDAGGNCMLDQIDLERSITKPEYKRRLHELQQRLYDMQQALFEARRPALIVFEGWAGTSKIGTI